MFEKSENANDLKKNIYRKNNQKKKKKGVNIFNVCEK